MKLLLDEQISGKVAKRLRDLGHDVVAVSAEKDLRGLSDPAIFEAAQTEGRVMVTYNRADFLELAVALGARDQTHAGLLIVNPRRHPNNQFAVLVAALEAFLQGFEPYPGFVTWLRG